MYCVICCHEDNKKFVIRDCGHSFHEKCLIKWKIQNHTCPICRDSDNYPPVVGFTNYTNISMIGGFFKHLSEKIRFK